LFKFRRRLWFTFGRPTEEGTNLKLYGLPGFSPFKKNPGF